MRFRSLALKIMARPSMLVLAAVAPVILFLQGCGSMSVPVGDPEKSSADPTLNGIWFFSDSGSGAELYVVEPFDKRTWLVWYVKVGRKSEAASDTAESESSAGPAMTPAEFFAWLKRGDEDVEYMPAYKVWLTRLGGVRFAVLESKLDFSAEDGVSPTGWDVFRLERDGDDRLKVTMVDTDFQDLNKAKSSREAEKIIRKNALNPALYGISAEGKDENAEGENVVKTLLRIPQSEYDTVRRLLDHGGKISTSRK